MPNSLVSNITVPNAAGTGYATYDLKDAWARDKITNEILPVLEGGMHFIGKTSTALVDGSTTNPITIIGETDPVTATTGDVTIIDSGKEFVWDGAAWREFGDLSTMGDFAYVDEGHVTVTPHGTVSKPSFTGSQSTVTITATDNSSGNYQPKGTVSQPTFTGSSSAVTITATEEADDASTYTMQVKGTVSQPTFNGDKYKLQGTVTPTGTVSQPTFSEGSISGTGTGSITVLDSVAVTTGSTINKTATVSPASSGTVTYTPAGTNTGTDVTLGYTNIYEITGVGSVATLTTTYTSGTENLQINFNGGSVPTRSQVSVATSVASVTDPTFSGTGVRLVTGNIAVPNTYTVTPTTASKTVEVTVTGTATGTVSQPTFSGNSNTVSITAEKVTTGQTITLTGTVTQPTFTGKKYTLTGTTTAAGTVSQPTFTGTKVQLSGTTTAAGSVSQPTFTGTAESWTVSPGPIPTP